MELPPAELPPEVTPFSAGPLAYVFARASSPSVRLALGLGALYGLVGGLLGALQVLGTAVAIALNQQEIALYQQQYAAFQECLRTNATPTFCHPPAAGVLAVNTIWALFLAAGLAAFILAQIAYARGAWAASVRTHGRMTGVVAALIAAAVGWLLYLAASVASVLAQASPFTMTAPPLGVEADALHLGAAIGYAIVDSLALLPALIAAAAAGLIGAQRGARAAGPSGYVVVRYGPPLPSSPSSPSSAPSSGTGSESLTAFTSPRPSRDRPVGA